MLKMDSSRLSRHSPVRIEGTDLEGDMREFPLAEILQFISLGSRSGVLEIVRREGVYGIVFTSGTITGLTSDGWTLANELRESQLLPDNVLTGLLSVNNNIQDLRAAILTGGYMTADEWTAFVSRQVERLLYSLFDVRDGKFRFRQSAPPEGQWRRARGNSLERSLGPRGGSHPEPPESFRPEQPRASLQCARFPDAMAGCRLDRRTWHADPDRRPGDPLRGRSHRIPPVPAGCKFDHPT
jgi:Domain of unknown function (DUF4388)